METAEFLLGASQIANYLGWTRSQVYRHRDKLPIGRFGHQMIASKEGLKDFLEKQIKEGDRNSINSG